MVQGFARLARSLCKLSPQCDNSQKQEGGQRRSRKPRESLSKLLMAHLFDQRSASTAQKVQSESGGPKKIKRTGFQGYEYLCQRGYFTCFDDSGTPHVACLVEDHRPLTVAKDSWTLFSAACEFTPLLCEIHPGSVNISVYCFDGGIHIALSRKLLQRHLRYHKGQRQQSVKAG